jgi:fructokinase
MKTEEINYFGGIEAGGTKFVCVIASGPDQIVAETSFPTFNPEDTIQNAVKFFKECTNYQLKAIGIASFGPVDLNPKSSKYGFITTTPKPGWANTDIVGNVKQLLKLPIGFDTDVNGAVLGEFMWGAGKDTDSIVYLTIGTGIGGGAISSGKIIHGLLHPEMGHIRIPHDWDFDPFPGNCPYHGDCLEGLASGPAIRDRWKMAADILPLDHRGWELEARYLALACVNYSLILSPQKIILGGGVLNHPGLIEKIQTEFRNLMKDYIQKDELIGKIDRYIVKPGLGNRAGVLGAIALAQEALK